MICSADFVFSCQKSSKSPLLKAIFSSSRWVPKYSEFYADFRSEGNFKEKCTAKR